MMVQPNIAQFIADEWERYLGEMPDPWRNPSSWENLFGSQIMSYRDKLDWQPLNYRGERIPRIVTVRRHLRRLGDNRTVRPLP
jgi:hypothetical protein